MTNTALASTPAHPAPPGSLSGWILFLGGLTLTIAALFFIDGCDKWQFDHGVDPTLRILHLLNQSATQLKEALEQTITVTRAGFDRAEDYLKLGAALSLISTVALLLLGFWRLVWQCPKHRRQIRHLTRVQAHYQRLCGRLARVLPVVNPRGLVRRLEAEKGRLLGGLPVHDPRVDEVNARLHAALGLEVCAQRLSHHLWQLADASLKNRRHPDDILRDLLNPRIQRQEVTALRDDIREFDALAMQAMQGPYAPA